MQARQTDISSFFGGNSAALTRPVSCDAVGKGSSDGEQQQEKKKEMEDGLEDDVLAVEASAPPRQTVVSSSDEDEVLVSSSDSDEGDLEKTEKKTRKRSRSSSPRKKAVKKTEGVGALAMKAAEGHQSVDIDAIITWNKGDPVPFSFLANTFEAIAEESKRLAITSLLTNSFRAIIEASPEDLLPTVYLCTNQVSPSHEGVELGLGDSTLIKALCQATGRKESAIKADYDQTGDLGCIAATARGSQKTMFKPKPLSVRGVLKSFREIASTEGSKSQEKKKNVIIRMLAAASENEAGYVMRALQGKLRIGLAEQTVLVALAHAILLQKGKILESGDDIAAGLEEGARIVKSVYSECPSYDELIPALLSMPIQDVPQKVHFKPGVPVKPMLAKPTNGVSEVLDKFANQPFTCEYKYDGERAQIHVLEDGTVKIYSRNSEDNTVKYPDIAAIIPLVLAEGTQSIVIDAEAVAYDPKENKILPFQVLSTRAKKDVTIETVKVPVCIYAFDCLYLNGKVLLKESLTTRREALYKALKSTPGKLEFATAKVRIVLQKIYLTHIHA